MTNGKNYLRVPTGYYLDFIIGDYGVFKTSEQNKTDRLISLKTLEDIELPNNGRWSIEKCYNANKKTLELTSKDKVARKTLIFLDNESDRIEYLRDIFGNVIIFDKIETPLIYKDKYRYVIAKIVNLNYDINKPVYDIYIYEIGYCYPIYYATPDLKDPSTLNLYNTNGTKILDKVTGVESSKFVDTLEIEKIERSKEFIARKVNYLFFIGHVPREFNESTGIKDFNILEDKISKKDTEKVTIIFKEFEKALERAKEKFEESKENEITADCYKYVINYYSKYWSDNFHLKLVEKIKDYIISNFNLDGYYIYITISFRAQNEYLAFNTGDVGFSPNECYAYTINIKKSK